MQHHMPKKIIWINLETHGLYHYRRAQYFNGSTMYFYVVGFEAVFLKLCDYENLYDFFREHYTFDMSQVDGQ